MKHFFCLIGLLLCYSLFAQLYGPRQLIDSGIIIRDIDLGDLNGDENPDLILGSVNLVAWYNNIDGQGAFSEAIPIEMDQLQSYSVEIVDMNENGINDIVVSYFDLDYVAWYPNDGFGNFGDKIIVASSLESCRNALPVDLDQDGDMDIVIGVTNGVGFYWAENINGQGLNWQLHTVDANPSQARSQRVGDIDGDGDLDIVSNMVSTNWMTWFENVDGAGQQWEHHIIEFNGLYESSFELVDMDGDGHLDIVSQKTFGSTSNPDNIGWRKNDGVGNFSPYEILYQTEFSTAGITDLKVGDIDNDGYPDIVGLVAHVFPVNNYIIWIKNIDNAGSFDEAEIIDSDFFKSGIVNLNDIDIDGDLDIILTTSPDNEIMWFENLTILNISEMQNQLAVLYPNPITQYLNIAFEEPIDRVLFYTVEGIKVLEITGNQKKIDVSVLKSGFYTVVIETGFGRSVYKVVKR
ncbi:T9SS type A sorting domain-containing protein [uncultured Planktosalinus sp.]|uniref:T9SS type A sorting domain-containing protein n=1 Tax=uncultured Planktosalinus sp. TaxID=1810935 RepID=UPI0030DD1AE8